MKYEFKGTKGNWIVEEDIRYEEDGPIVNESLFGYNILSDTDGEYIVGYDGMLADELDKHNANLIAAAPDLLSVAIEYLEAYKDSNEYYFPFIEKFRQVVHKALNIQNDENKSK